ncbi:hemolysin family protein [Lactobacillus sp. YT155]|uniref:hemolysin family protein n=1 Tax=Lactobacillus sp. YT155 TaxID=3060955 RepID=UPI00265D7B13|nr:hemolysin family protein [Lactobacillus sp. YT155]MDO1605177.1 hemolysin family protein [Lactobacillus sp. YT155]
MEDPGTSVLISQLILIIVLTLINAFFAAGETAILSLNKTKIETKAKEGDKKSQKLVAVLNDSTNYLATVQVAITFAGFLSSASAAVTMSKMLAQFIGGFEGSQELSIIIITLILSYFSLVFGELYPKQIAIQKSEKVVNITAPFIRFFGVVFKPLVALLSFSTKLLLRITPIDFTKKEDALSRNEVLSVLEKSKTSGSIDDEEYDMLEGIIGFSNMTVREVMVPRTDAFMIDINNDQDENIDAILNHPFSRVPVYGGDKDKVIGVIHIKDLLKYARRNGFDNLSLPEIMTEPLYVLETTNVNDLLFEMKNTHQQLSIVIDEYGGVVGIATIEDLIEEIVGEIDDEHDQDTLLYQKVNANTFKVEGKLNLNDFNRIFDEELDKDDVDTVAGYLITEVGEIPSNNNQLSCELEDGVKLISGEVKGSRVQEVLVELPPEKSKIVKQNLSKRRAI